MKKLLALALAMLALVTTFMSATYAWQGLPQTATNELYSAPMGFVRLQKLDKETKQPLAGASFLLFKDGDESLGQTDEQIGELYTTNAKGYLSYEEDGEAIALPVGEYYFVEHRPADGYDFEKNSDGSSITKHSFTITEDNTYNLEVYNIRKTADLTITKTIPGVTPLEDWEEQRYFRFLVEIDDGKDYAQYYDYKIYSAADGTEIGEGGALCSGQYIELKYGRYAVIKGLPQGAGYRVTEQADDDYILSSSGHSGTIDADGATAAFSNSMGSLVITKRLENNDESGEGPNAEMLYHFQVNVNGDVRDTAPIKAGESITINGLPIGASYTITELTPEFPRELLKVEKTDENGNVYYEYREPQGNEIAARYYALKGEQSGEINSAETIALEFINVYDPSPDQPGSLEINKTVSGAIEPGMETMEFGFYVQLGDGQDHEYEIYDAYGELLLSEDAYAQLPEQQTVQPAVQPEADQDPYLSTPENREEVIQENPEAAPEAQSEGQEDGGTQEPTGDSGANGAEDTSPPADTETQPQQPEVENPVQQPVPAPVNTKRVLTGGSGYIYLKNGEQAVFTGLPHGISYTVEETEDQGMSHDLSRVSGLIVSGERAGVNIVNKAQCELVITKKLSSIYENEPLPTRDFQFYLYVDGEFYDSFSLHNEESKRYYLPQGSSYELREEKLPGTEYQQSMENGAGTIDRARIEVLAKNTYIGRVSTRIEGVKEWNFGDSEPRYPESITVYLKQGVNIIASQTVYPDESGRWSYSFTAEKYDAYGGEIVYSVEEKPLESFEARYRGYDIINDYVPPVSVDPPVLTKTVRGAGAPDMVFEFAMVAAQEDYPMPEGSEQGRKVIRLTGGGSIEFGEIEFTSPGVYEYTVSELGTAGEGWSYDKSVYSIVFTVTKADGALNAEYSLIKNAEPASRLSFVNVYDRSYDGEKLTISGEKTWDHGDNPKKYWPSSIIISVYAEGSAAPVASRTVSADENGRWFYSFELPRYASGGAEIKYSVNESPVECYKPTVVGYNIKNTYNEEYVVPTPTPVPGGPEKPVNTPKPGRPGGGGGSWWSPQTGDNSFIAVWIVFLLVSSAALVYAITLVLRKGKCKSKHLKSSEKKIKNKAKREDKL